MMNIPSQIILLGGQSTKIIFILLTMSIGLISCVPSNNSQVEEAGGRFPINLVEEEDLVAPLKENQQLAYCYFDHALNEQDQAWYIGITSLDQSIDTKLVGPYEQIDKHNLGCLEGGIYGLDWSLDGKFLLFNDHNNLLVLSEIATNGEQLSIAPLLNPPQYTFYDFAHAPTWSPNGNKVAFISQFQEGPPEPGSPYIAPSVFVIETDNPDAQPEPLQLYNFLPGVVSNLAWSHDGNYSF